MSGEPAEVSGRSCERPQWMVGTTMEEGPQSSSPRRSLFVLRVIWAALLLGQLGFFMVLVAVILPAQAPTRAGTGIDATLAVVSWALLVIMVGTGYFIRGQTYKKNWRGDVVTPAGYVTGNLLLLGLCEGASFNGLVMCILSGGLWPMILVSVVAVAVQLVNYPNGAAMLPAGNEYEAQRHSHPER